MSTASLPAPLTWTDSKRYLWPLGAGVMGLPMIGLALFLLTGYTAWLWLPPVILYVVIPAMDWIFGEDSSNPPESAMPALAADRYYRWAIFAAVPAYLASWGTMAWYASSHALTWYQWLPLAVSAGIGCGLAINIAHELGHQTDGIERWLAKLTLSPGAYGHFYVEHNRGHHVRVATPEDPASSRFGESFYEFFPRCVIGSFKSAWQIEAQRLQRNGKGVWHWSNDILQTTAMTLVIWAAMIAWLGWVALPFMLFAAVYGGALLEVVNYLEHYGLQRQKGPDGRYERCQPKHSWNSNHVVTNLLLYHLQRHSDHHANPTRSYQTLRHFDGLPELPSGYAAMIVIAYVPWLWFRIMDPKVIAHHNGDMSKANIKPSIRERVLAQYPARASTT